jgi:hypothetical protein
MVDRSSSWPVAANDPFIELVGVMLVGITPIVGSFRDAINHSGGRAALLPIASFRDAINRFDATLPAIGMQSGAAKELLARAGLHYLPP